MSIEMVYRPYRSEGYTDDLGIIADRNQWVPEQPEGWHIRIDRTKWYEIREWLDENGIMHETYFSNIVLHRRKDAMLFEMRWA